MTSPKLVSEEDLRAWHGAEGLATSLRSIGSHPIDDEYVEQVLGLPLHLRRVVAALPRAQQTKRVEDLFASIPFYSLCRGLFMPLASMSREKVAQLFGIDVPPPPDLAGKEELIKTFLAKDLGLTTVQKIACILGDPFRGRPSTFRRDSMVRLLMSVQMKSRRRFLDRLPHVGEVAVLFAEARPQLKGDPPLTAAEVLETLRIVPEQKQADKYELLRTLLLRCGKVEAYFLARMLLRKAGFGFDYQQPLLARAIAHPFGAEPEQIAHAIALTDPFHVVDVLEKDGLEGLKSIQIKPLVPIRPALAGGSTDEIKSYPVWVERKYDGVRLMLHKSTGPTGSVLAGAYTRNRGDWLELVPGLDATIRMIPARDVILDGELYGSIVDLEGARPASVYEVYGALTGEGRRAVNMRFAAFDIIYANGQDLTGLALSERRNRLSMLLGSLAAMPLPVPLTVAEGQLAQSKDDVNRLYHHFRAQGYEGVITKDLSGPYLLGARNPTWAKRKPVVTLDLVIMGATFAVTTKENVGRFGSYVVGARTRDGGFEIVGDVAGVDRARDMDIQAEIMREGLITGRRIERPSASGVRAGIELLPHMVVTVKFEGITKDGTGRLALRDPKLAEIRSDKTASEADRIETLDRLYLKQRVG